MGPDRTGGGCLSVSRVSAGLACREGFLCLMPFYRESTETASRDYSGMGILLSNGVVILLALFEGWSLESMMLIYWVQSVIIGISQFFRMLLLRSFCTEGFTSNGRRVSESPAGKRSTAIFFAFHYGIFHLVYGMFLIGLDGGEKGGGLAAAGAPETGPGWWSETGWFLVSVLSFVAGHGYSFYQNVRADLERKPNLGVMMFLPYARIIPMHLVILLGGRAGDGMGMLLLFSGLKTGADYLMHVVEHRVLQKKPSRPKRT